MSPSGLSFRIYGITVFLNALTFAGTSLWLGNVGDFFMSFPLFFLGIVVAFPVLLILILLMRLSIRIPYSSEARAVWLVWWMSVAILLLYSSYFRLFTWAFDLDISIITGITIVTFIVTFVVNRKAYIRLITEYSSELKS